MATPPDVMVHDVPDSPRPGVSIHPVQVVHNAAVSGDIGHLPADKSGLHFRTAKELFQLLLYFCLHPGNEPGALIVKHIHIAQRFHSPVFGVPV